MYLMQCLTDIKLTKWPKMLAKGLLFEMFWNLAGDYNTWINITKQWLGMSHYILKYASYKAKQTCNLSFSKSFIDSFFL